MLFMIALPVPFNFNCFWRGSNLKIFFRGEGLGERTKTRLYSRALFVHCDVASLTAFLSLNGTFNEFLIIFLWLLSAQGQCKLIKIVDAVC